MNNFKNIELNYEVNYNDVKELFLYPYKKYMWIYYLVVFSIILVLLIKFISIDLSILIPGYLIYVFIILIIKFKRINKKIKKFEATSTLCNSKNIAIFSDESIKISNQTSESIYTWNRLVSYFQTKNLHVLIIEGGDTTLFPKRYFDDELNSIIEINIKEKIAFSKKNTIKNNEAETLENNTKDSGNIIDEQSKHLSFVLTLNDMRRLVYYYNRKINFLYLLAFFLISISQIGFIKTHNLMYIFISLSLVLFRVFILEFQTRNRFKSNPLRIGEVNIYLKDEGLKLKSIHYNANKPWNSFYKYTNLKHFHILNTDNIHSYFLPKRYFTNKVNQYLEKKFEEKIKRK